MGLMLALLRKTDGNYSERVTKPLRVFLRTTLVLSLSSLNRLLKALLKHYSIQLWSENYVRQLKRSPHACLCPASSLAITLDTPSMIFCTSL